MKTTRLLAATALCISALFLAAAPASASSPVLSQGAPMDMYCKQTWRGTECMSAPQGTYLNPCDLFRITNGYRTSPDPSEYRSLLTEQRGGHTNRALEQGLHLYGQIGEMEDFPRDMRNRGSWLPVFYGTPIRGR